MESSLKKIKEIALVERIAKRFKIKDKSVVTSIGDDTAVVRCGNGKYLLYTVDMLVEGVHFKKDEDYEKVGYKAMAVSVSDIAAMAGVPKYALVSVGLPRKNTDRIVKGLFAGISRCAKKFDIAVIGGDTNRSDRLVIDVFMIGEVEPHNLVLRSNAKPGDYIFVSGPLGGSLKGKHLNFCPRIEEARFLVKNFKINSMMDLSDGLGLDLNRIVEASSVGALIFEDKIPISKEANGIESALYDGEDFELLFTLPACDGKKLLKMVEGKKCAAFYMMGEITSLFKGVRMRAFSGKEAKIHPKGFKHF